MRVLQVILMLSVFLGLNYYVFYRLWNMLPVGFLYRLVLILSAIVVISAPFLLFTLGDKLPYSVTSALNSIGFSWFIIFLYLLLVFLSLDLLRVLKVFPVETILYSSWVGIISLTVFVVLITSAGYVRYTTKDRVELLLNLNKQTDSELPLKIVAISDLHLGYGIGGDELVKWIDYINKENPDVVLIAGDLIDNNVHPLYEKNMAALFSRINSKYGVYSVLGNHEYIAGVENSIQFMKDAGITLLRDSVALVDDRFYIVGRDDRSNVDRKPLDELVASLDKSKPIIMLDHQPYNLEEAEQNKIDLQISGHTHYGQVWPISLVTDLIYEKAHGYIKKGDTHIYVSSGIGIWGGKFRIGTSSEYVVVNLSGKSF
jgi:Predicted phosphohydrolases